MKKILYIIAASAAIFAATAQADAQMSKEFYINGGWQFNGTLANDFAESAQGYGAYLEGGYFVTPMFAVGIRQLQHKQPVRAYKDLHLLGPVSPYYRSYQIDLSGAVRRHYEIPFHEVDVPALCRGQGRRAVFYTEYLHVDIRQAAGELGILCFARNRSDILPIRKNRLRIPGSGLLQLCHK